MSGFDWADFLELARRLTVGEQDDLSEARYRTAVSRAYYAAFNRCRELAVRSGWRPSGRSRDHRELVDWLAKKKGKYILARELSELRSVRNDADYDASAAVDSWKSEADRCLKMAHSFLSDLTWLMP